MRRRAVDSKEKKPIGVCLEFHCEKARTVCIAGSFNDWSPDKASMRNTGAGRWLKELSLAPGQYEYQYVVDGKWINDPRAVKSTRNAYGGRNSVLVVEVTSQNRFQGRNCVYEFATRNENADAPRGLKGHRTASKNQK